MTDTKTTEKLILDKLKDHDSVLSKREIQYMLNTVNKETNFRLNATDIAYKFLIAVESADEGFRIDDQITKQGFDWLAKERRKSKNRDQFEYGIAEVVLDNFGYFTLRGFREVNQEKGRKFPFYVPNWMVFSNRNTPTKRIEEFEYHNFGGLVITG